MFRGAKGLDFQESVSSNWRRAVSSVGQADMLPWPEISFGPSLHGPCVYRQRQGNPTGRMCNQLKLTTF